MLNVFVLVSFYYVFDLYTGLIWPPKSFCVSRDFPPKVLILLHTLFSVVSFIKSSVRTSVIHIFIQVSVLTVRFIGWRVLPYYILLFYLYSLISFNESGNLKNFTKIFLFLHYLYIIFSCPQILCLLSVFISLLYRFLYFISLLLIIIIVLWSLNFELPTQVIVHLFRLPLTILPSLVFLHFLPFVISICFVQRYSSYLS